MATILSLPSFCTFKFGTLPYLCLQENPAQIQQAGFVSFVENRILSPRAKFAVEPSQTGDVTLVNIRSCYNNKYWVAQQASGRPTSTFIFAYADKPQEDKTKPGCTLFQAQQGVREQVLLFHIGMSMYVILGGGTPDEWSRGLQLHREAPHGFAVVDWESLMILPPHVSFRSEGQQGDYVCSRLIDRVPYLSLESELDAGDRLVAHDLSPANDGSYNIQSLHFGQPWRKNPQNWIVADGVDEGTRPHSDKLFSFVKVSDNVFSLRNVTNTRFCGRLTLNGKANYLNARFSSISEETRLVIEERVLQRDISQIQYRLSDSRIYQEETQEFGYTITTNPSPDKEATLTLSHALYDSSTTNWTNDMSITSGTIKVNFNVTKVPRIVNGVVELSTELNGKYEWGVIKTTPTLKEATHTVIVPPLTTLKVTFKCTKATCDVPFAYTQSDLIITNGVTVVNTKDDGIFTGTNYYDFRYESSVHAKDD